MSTAAELKKKKKSSKSPDIRARKSRQEQLTIY